MFVADIPDITPNKHVSFKSLYVLFTFIFLYMLHKSGVLIFETVCQGQCVNRKYLAAIFRDKFWPKFQQEFSRKFQQECLQKFQNFGSNLNKIFYKILANLNILPIIFAVVLLSLLQYYNKNPVRNLVSVSAILLLKYCYTFSYRNVCYSEQTPVSHFWCND